MAFIIGVTINNACASKIDNMSDSELRNLVSQLQQEVNSLKERVAELENKLGGSSGRNSGNTTANGGFEVDGIHFNSSGSSDSPYDYVEYYVESYQILNGVRQEGTQSSSRLNTKYNYDSKGRITSTENTYLSPSTTVKSSITQYTYSNKTITTTTTTKYIDDVSRTGGLSEYGYSIVYHFK